MALGGAPSKIDFSMSEVTRVQKKRSMKLPPQQPALQFIIVEEKVKIEIKLIFGD